MRKLNALKTKFPLWLRVVLTSTRSVLGFLIFVYTFLTVVFTPSFGPRFLVVGFISSRLAPTSYVGVFFFVYWACPSRGLGGGSVSLRILGATTPTYLLSNL
jgi:hypothetical protein